MTLSRRRCKHTSDSCSDKRVRDVHVKMEIQRVRLFSDCRGMVYTMSHSVCNFTDSGAPVEELATAMDAESVQYGCRMSTVRGRRVHWMSAVTEVGVSTTTTAITAETSLSNVMFSRRLQVQMVFF